MALRKIQSQSEEAQTESFQIYNEIIKNLRVTCKKTGVFEEEEILESLNPHFYE